jgi:hypothetical protein
MALRKLYLISLLLPFVILRGQESSRLQRPTLGFAREKGVSPVSDSDAEAQEQNHKQDGAPDESARNSRKVHEAALFAEFLDGLRLVRDCSGIRVTVEPRNVPTDFLVLVRVWGHDSHPDNQSWSWIVSRPGVQLREGIPSVGLGGMGSAANANLAARDVCRTIWEDLDPNRLHRHVDPATPDRVPIRLNPTTSTVLKVN